MLRDWPRPLDLRQQYRLLRPSWPSGKSGDCPRHRHVDDRAEEEEEDELEQAALHGIILRLGFSSPAAFGATGGEVTAKVVAALDAEAPLAADHPARSERAKREQPKYRRVEDSVDREAGPDWADG